MGTRGTKLALIVVAGLAGPSPSAAHDLPLNTIVNGFVRLEPTELHLVVRVPLDLLHAVPFPVTPTATGRLDGTPGSSGGWDYKEGGELGADVRWGIRQNLMLNGTWNPDFSQVEADVGQVTLNERFALFYPEKRPFFLESLDLFQNWMQTFYSRRIGKPTTTFAPDETRRKASA